MLYCLFVLGVLCLIFGVVYPAIMAVILLLFYRNKQDFIEFMMEV